MMPIGGREYSGTSVVNARERDLYSYSDNQMVGSEIASP